MPGASGNQWTTGAVGCPDRTGVRLRDVLEAAGVKDTAVYIGHYGNDPHLSGDPEKIPISRGIPIAKALEEDALIAWAMNGEPLPAIHGFPLRLVVPGYPGSCAQKWLARIWVRDQVHDGEKMGGYSCRMPAYPIAPGTEIPESDMVIMGAMPVKSLITSPATRANVSGLTLEVRGHARAYGDVAAVHVSHDFGQTWAEARLEPPANRYAWQHFSASIDLPQAGYYEIWSRATDMQGRTQPITTPGWNQRGYGNNMVHRIAVLASQGNPGPGGASRRRPAPKTDPQNMTGPLTLPRAAFAAAILPALLLAGQPAPAQAQTEIPDPMAIPNPMIPNPGVPMSPMSIAPMQPLGGLGAQPETAVARDPEPGNLPVGPGLEDTFSTCTACHSARTFARQRPTDARREYLWGCMIREQGMPEYDDELRASILSYLKTHF